MPSHGSGRRWLRMSLVAGGTLLLLLGLLVTLAPTLAGSLGRGLIEGRIAGAVNGTASIRQLSLGWFGQQRIEGLDIRDTSGQTAIAASAVVDNGLLDLLLGRVDTLRVQVEGSVRARLRPDGSLSAADLPKASSSPSPPRAAASAAPPELPFPIRLEVKRFELQLDDDAGVAVALRDFKGSAEVGRGRPLQADFTGATQVRDQSGQVTVKVLLQDFLSQAGRPDLASMVGSVQASVSGFMLPVAGLEVQVQSAAFSVQAEAGKPIAVQAQAGLSLERQPASVQVSLQATRPDSGVAMDAWAIDPRTWTGSIEARQLPSTALDRWLKGTPLVAARDLGPTVDLSIQGGAGEAKVRLVASRVQVQASAAVDAASGAVQGRDAVASIDLDPALLAALGVQVSAPGRVQAKLDRFATPPVGPQGLDLSAISLEGSVALDPLAVQGLTAEPVQLTAAVSFQSPALAESVGLSVNASVQQQPIQASLQLAGLGPKLDPARARVQATLSAGPLDPALLPGLPAEIRSRLAKAGLGTTTVRASLAGGVGEGSGQLQLDTQAGTVAAKGSWDTSDVQVQEIRAGLLLQPALVNDLARGSVTLVQPMPVQLTAGPVRLPRQRLQPDAAIPVNVAVTSIELGPVPGACGSGSVRGLKVQGNVSPSAGPMFDGTVSIDGISLVQVPQAGAVQANGISVQGKVMASPSQLFSGNASLVEAMASAVDGVGPVQVKTLSIEATVPQDMKQSGHVGATVGLVGCPRVPGLSSGIQVQSIIAAVDGPLLPAAGTTLSLQAEARDASAPLARLKAGLSQQQDTQEISLDLTQVDMRRVLALMGSVQEMPDWVGTSGDRSLAARVRSGPGGMAFSVQAALDPITMQAQGTRGIDGAVAISTGELKARLPAEVVKSLLTSADPGLAIQSCQPLQVAMTVRGCTLPGDGQGGVRVVGKGADLDVTARLEPWTLQLVDTPSLAFGGADLALVSRGGEQLRLDLKGSLAAGQSRSAPLEVQVTAAQGMGPDGRVRLDPDRLALLISMRDFPTGLVDRASGMDGYLIDMLGPVFSVNLSGRTGSGPEDFLQAGLSSPTLSVKAPRVRFASGTVSITPDAPVVASLQPDDRFRQRVLRPINPFFADLRTTDGRPIMATVQSLRMPVPVDTRSLDTTFSVEVGEVEMEKSDQFLALMDLAIASKGRTVPGLVSPLAGSVTAGVLTYRDFKVQVGRLGKSGWQQTLLSDARINLGSAPPMAEPITIRYPAASVANLLSGIPGARGLLGKLNDALGSNGEKVGEIAQVAIDFTGPLDGGKLKETVRPEFEVPKGLGEEIRKGAEKAVGDALGGIGDLFGGGKK
ncbi:MAG: hypothetical protein EBQ99_06455 [Planctomycetes bacterium]|nr:hypothetical protein [Planctomycetota bacterium]